jgi:hypothetical protein
VFFSKNIVIAILIGIVIPTVIPVPIVIVIVIGLIHFGALPSGFAPRSVASA